MVQSWETRFNLYSFRRWKPVFEHFLKHFSKNDFWKQFLNTNFQCFLEQKSVWELGIFSTYIPHFQIIFKNNFYMLCFICNHFPYLYNYFLKQPPKSSENNWKQIKYILKKQLVFRTHFQKNCFLSKKYQKCFRVWKTVFVFKNRWLFLKTIPKQAHCLFNHYMRINQYYI